MKVKVKAKKGTYQSTTMTVLLLILFGAIAAFFVYSMSLCSTFNELLDRYGLAIPLVVIFGLVDLIGIIFLIKPAKEHKAVLESSTNENGHIIYRLKLLVNKDAAIMSNLVFIDSIDDLGLSVGSTYKVYMKELNNKIVAIDTNITDESITTMPSIKTSFAITIIAIMTVPIMTLSLCIYGIIYFPEHWYAYIIVGIISFAIIMWLIRMKKSF